MTEEQDNQIERSETGGINRRSETARRGSDAAGFVRGLANRRTESNLPRIVSIGDTYEFLLEWGTYGPGDGQFEFPVDIAVAADGTVYVTESRYRRIQKFTSEGVFVSQWGTSGTGDGEFINLGGVAVAPDRSVYVTDRFQNRIQKFTSDGVFVSKWGRLEDDDWEVDYPSGASVFDTPNGVTVASDGSVYVAETGAYRIQGNYRIQKFTSEGVFVSKWGAQGSGDGEFSESLDGVAVASDGSVYVADGGNHRIQQFSPSR